MHGLTNFVYIHIFNRLNKDAFIILAAVLIISLHRLLFGLKHLPVLRFHAILHSMMSMRIKV